MRCVVEPLAEAGAVLERDPEVGIGDVDVEAALPELELLDHDLVEQPDDVGAGADDEVGVLERALERAGAAEPLASLEHEDPLAGLGEVGGGGEAVVAAADDHRVPVACGQLLGGRGESDLAEPLCDRVHGEISLAMASTTTAPSSWTRTGLHSISSRPCSSLRREARRAAAGRSALAEQGGALELPRWRARRARDRRGAGRSRRRRAPRRSRRRARSPARARPRPTAPRRSARRRAAPSARRAPPRAG